MLDKIRIVKQRFDEVSDLIIQPDIMSDQKRYIRINKEYKDLSAVMKIADEYKSLLSNIDEAKEIIADGSDEEMTEMAKMELEEASNRLPKLEDAIKFMLIPKDPDDAKNVDDEIKTVFKARLDKIESEFQIKTKDGQVKAIKTIAASKSLFLKMGFFINSYFSA